MSTLLRLDTSILGDNSVSRCLLDELETRLRNVLGPLAVVYRDFNSEPVPHLDAQWLQALTTAPEDRSSEQQRQADYSDNLVSELQSAEILLIGLPMYNFSVPSMLKAWNDHVARAGVTFEYSESGPRGLLENKKAYLVATMGGQHEPEETDYLRPYMKQFLGFLGITDIEFVTASGLNLGAEHRQSGLDRALNRISRIPANASKEKAA